MTITWSPSRKWKQGFSANVGRVFLAVYRDLSCWRWSVTVCPFQQAEEVVFMGMCPDPDVAKAKTAETLIDPCFVNSLSSFVGVKESMETA